MERDDWTSFEGPSFDSLTAPVDPEVDTPVDDPLSSRRPSGAQVVIAAVVGAVLVVGGVVALVRRDTQVAETVNTVPESGTLPSADGAPATTVGGGVPAFWNDDPTETSDPAETSDPVADEPSAMGTSSIGEVPVWNTWSIDVPAPLDALAEATEVVAFGADGILYRIAFPSGQVQAMRMTGWDSSAQAVVGEEAIVVFAGYTVSIIHDDEPIVSVPIRRRGDLRGGVAGTNQFIVTAPSPALAGGEQQLTLGLDGTLAPLDSHFVDASVLGAVIPPGRSSRSEPARWCVRRRCRSVRNSPQRWRSSRHGRGSLCRCGVRRGTALCHLRDRRSHG